MDLAEVGEVRRLVHDAALVVERAGSCDADRGRLRILRHRAHGLADDTLDLHVARGRGIALFAPLQSIGLVRERGTNARAAEIDADEAAVQTLGRFGAMTRSRRTLSSPPSAFLTAAL